MIIYLDMDGTLVDFVSQVNKYGFWRKDRPDKVDWDKVMEPRFWAELEWMPGAEEAFLKLQRMEKEGAFLLYILSSIDFEEGRKGKRQWILQHTDFPLEKVIFCLEPEDKAKWLIDDRKK